MHQKFSAGCKLQSPIILHLHSGWFILLTELLGAIFLAELPKYPNREVFPTAACVESYGLSLSSTHITQGLILNCIINILIHLLQGFEVLEIIIKILKGRKNGECEGHIQQPSVLQRERRSNSWPRSQTEQTKARFKTHSHHRVGIKLLRFSGPGAEVDRDNAIHGSNCKFGEKQVRNRTAATQPGHKYSQANHKLRRSSSSTTRG